MEHTRLKLNIQNEQLIWFLAILLNEREIFKILRRTDVVPDPDRLHSSSKRELLSRLTNAFFRHSHVDEIIVQFLSKKAKAAKSRVGIMVVDEIQTYFRSPGPLIESGEFGEVVWALMTDSREDVHSHGLNLLTAAYETHNESYSGVYQLNLALDTTNSTQVTQQLKENQDNNNPVIKEINSKNKQQKSEIQQLTQTLNNIRESYTTIQKEHKQLEQQYKLLHEENEALKSKEVSYQQNEKQIVLLRKENENLQQKNLLQEENNSSLMKLEAEHQLLLQKYEDISSQLRQLSQIQSSKDSILIELKLVQESVYNEFQTLEKLKTDFQNHFSSIEKSYEVSRNSLNQLRQTVDNFGEPEQLFANQPEPTGTQERVGVFVDVQNMFYAAKDRFERRVDYIKLLDLIVGPRQLITAYAYIVQIPEINQSNFLSLLEHNGYTIRSKDLRLRGDGSAKGDWDVGIAVDVVSMLGSLDVVILASGDGDFCPLADLIKQQHKRIEVVAFEHNTSMDLQTTADQFFPIGEELLM